MSYEGYTQHLCPSGHYFCLPEDYRDTVCPTCNASPTWSNAVDDTNCEGVGYIDMESLLVSPAEIKTCDLGHEHIVKEAIYRIPSEEERHSLQTYLDEDGNRKPLTGDWDNG